MRIGDLSEATHDALLARLRNMLRKQHGYPRASTEAGKPRKRVPKMGVRVLWLDQPTILPEAWQEAQTSSDSDLQGLSCAGYGSSVTVTASMGLAAAAEAVNKIIHTQAK
jgi:tRNA A37 threonylcarbamoyladenosine dehydratase